ncbi:ABC transporter ATP-binding protein [bacterium]|nr:ABC transporter ATP-binding protein [bacterium]
MITFSGVHKSYGDNDVLKGVDFTVSEGTIHGYLGPNGAGKSTSLKLLLGLLVPDKGRVSIAGLNPATHPVEVRKRIGFVPEELSLYEHLTPYEFLHVLGEIHGMVRDSAEERMNNLLELFGINHVKHHLLSSFSRGMKQKVMISAALLHDPDVLLLDEPLSGMDVNAVLIFRDLIRQLANEGKTIIYSSHIIEVVERVCDRVTLLLEGQIRHEGEMSEIRKATGSLETLFRESPGAPIQEISLAIIEKL